MTGYDNVYVIVLTGLAEKGCEWTEAVPIDQPGTFHAKLRWAQPSNADAAKHNASSDLKLKSGADDFVDCMYCGKEVRRIDIDDHAFHCTKRPSNKPWVLEVKVVDRGGSLLVTLEDCSARAPFKLVNRSTHLPLWYERKACVASMENLA